MTLKEDQRLLIRALITSTMVGMVLWTGVVGFMHAYIFSIDWSAMFSGDGLSNLFHTQPFISLLIMGALIGFFTEFTKFLGGVARSEALVLFGPMMIGILMGFLQGILVGTELWGFVQWGVLLRTFTTRVLFGAICGFIVIPPTIMISIRLRRRI